MPKKKEEKTETKEVKSDFFKDQTEQEFIDWVDKQTISHPVVKTQHGTWKLLIAWELGNQFTKWNDTDRAVVDADLVTRKKKVVINLMKPLNETIEGKLNFSHRIIGVPNSGEQKDIMGSQVATKILDYNDYVNGMEELMEEMKHDLLRPGISCIKWYWDESAYGYSKNGKKIPGEVIGEVVPIFNIRPDPTAKNRKALRWVIELKEVTRNELKKTFELSDEKIDSMGEAKATKYSGMNEPVEEKDKDEDTYILKEFWERPSWLYQEGRFIQTCCGEKLYAGKNPNPEGDIPHFFFFYKKSPYSFWPKGPLHFVQDIQREFNRTVSIISEHIEAWKPKLAVSKGGIKRAGSLTTEAFEIVEVGVPGQDIKPVNMPELSAQVTEHRNFLIQSRDLVSNVHEVSYARLPQYASRAPASLYSMMLEQENVKLSPMVKRINKTLVEMATFRLKLMDKKYSVKRMVKIVGENKQATVDYFEKTELAQNFDVRIETGVSLNQSTTIQQRLMMEMWQAGIFQDKDRIKVLRMMNLGTAEYELRSDVADDEKAIRENQAFKDGNYDKKRQEGGVSVNWNDDHELHLDRHTDLLKSEEVQKWDDELYQALEMHVFEHFIFYQKLAMAMAGQMGSPQQMAQERMGGVPGRPQVGEPAIEGFGGA